MWTSKLRLSFSLAFVVCLLCAVGSARQDNWKSLWQSARAAASKADYKAAEGLYGQALAGADQGATSQELGSLELEYGRLLAINLQKQDVALPHLKKAAELFGAPDDVFYKAIALVSAGDCCYTIGALEDARTAYRQTLDCLGRPIPDDEQARAKIVGAQAWRGLGSVELGIGSYDSALDDLHKALRAFEDAKVASAAPGVLAAIASVHQSLGLYAKASEFCSDALTRLEKMEKPNQPTLATVLTGAGNAAWGLGDYKQAMEYHNRALAIWKTLANPTNVANEHNSIGAVHWSTGEYDKALESYDEARKVRETLNDKKGLAQTLNNIGAAYYSKKDYERALEYYKNSSNLIGETPGGHENLGEVYLAKGDLEKAGAELVEALKGYEKASQFVGEAADLAAFQQANQKGIYALMADLEMRLGDDKQAIEFAEQGRVQALAKQIALNIHDWLQYIPEADRNALKKASEDLAAARAKLAFLDRQSAGSKEPAKEVVTQRVLLTEAEQRVTILTDAAFAKNPKMARLRADAAASAREIQKLGRDNPDTAFFEFVCLSEKTIVFSANADSIKSFAIGLGRNKLQEVVASYLKALTTSEDAEAKEAKFLYQQLIQPLAPALGPGTKHVVFVADGPLLDLPFAALSDASGKRLIENYTVSTAHSLTAISVWRENPSASKKPALVVAEPSSGLIALPHALEEGEAVAKALPGSTLSKGAEATEAEVKKQMADCAVLHFACHGLLNSRVGLRSALALATPAPDSGEDGMLEAREIAWMQLSAQLAVLSACDTAKGSVGGGEGLLGLVWAFRAAGVPAVVASNWPLDDAAAGRMMTRFYTELKAGARKDDALRAAMLEEMKVGGPNGQNRSATGVGGSSGKKSNAYYWAAFKLIGDSTPLGKQDP